MTIIQIRRDTAANWTTINTILSSGEQGLETNTRKRKTGDGVTAWISLAYDAGAATTTTQGIVQLAGDLAGTAAAPTVPLLASHTTSIAANTTSIAANTTSIAANTTSIAGRSLTTLGGQETLRVVAAAGSTVAVDLTQGNVLDITLTAATCALTMPTLSAPGKTLAHTVIVRQDGTGNRNLTFPSSVTWADGGAPVLSSLPGSVDVLSFISVDGGVNWLAFGGKAAAGGAASGISYGARIRPSTTSQTAPAGSSTIIMGTTEDDNAGMTGVTANSLVVPTGKAGRWLCTGGWNGGGGGSYQSFIAAGAKVITLFGGKPMDRHTLSGVANLVVGDAITLGVYSASGTIPIASANQGDVWLSASYLGPIA